VRRLATPLLVLATLALGVAAAVDAVRGGGSAEAPPTEAERDGRELRSAAVRDLRSAGIRGKLVVAGEDCFVRVLVLPELVQEPSEPLPGCSLTVSPGVSVGVEREVVARSGDRARCDGGIVERLRGRLVVGGHRGCNPAWRPDGVLTLVRGGGVWAVGRCDGFAGRGCTRAVLPRAALEREFGRVGQRGTTWVEEVAWIDVQTVAVIAGVRDGGRSADVLAVFEGRRLVASPLGPYDDLALLRVSPLGTHVATVSPEQPSVVVATRRGTFVREAPEAAAVAWSPDERWVALARGGEVVVSDGIELGAEVTITVPLPARDLAWR
jgi:hypothetical protein